MSSPRSRRNRESPLGLARSRIRAVLADLIMRGELIHYLLTLQARSRTCASHVSLGAPQKLVRTS